MPSEFSLSRGSGRGSGGWRASGAAPPAAPSRGRRARSLHVDIALDCSCNVVNIISSFFAILVVINLHKYRQILGGTIVNFFRS